MYGGFIIGLVCVLATQTQGRAALVAIAAWVVLAGINALPVWAMIRHKPWWTGPTVMSAGVIGAAVGPIVGGVGAVLGTVVWVISVFVEPLLAIWIGAVLCAAKTRDSSSTDQCRVCGYDLRGLPLPRCPECATPFAA